MKWSDCKMSWGDIKINFAIFWNKVLKFNYEHLEASNFTNRGKFINNSKKN